MKKLSAIFICALLANMANAQDISAQKQNDLEFTRLNQEIARLKEENEQHAMTVRSLEQKNTELSKQTVGLNKRIDDLLDLWVNFENVSLPNLVAADKALADRINETNNHIKEQTTIWNWGEQSRDCKGVGTHQQVRTVLSQDGISASQYLCFDGKIIHLKTTSNIPPVK